ncbi:LysR family transcriptional regulator [Peptoniphilus sp. MSJ-1]|uniref:LysR family transcriptional regulator n=1 Tax=Peptoniphilus ovalis TaxID=2841503 RepID=A0ABS6FDM0_9FIRM|nr:LysR family transcriptional regulator [Peptoniphilus ovalis]MBU5668275.1 LysR family transcriptional regulator [Peptoniphilus ovalis]
MDTINFSYVLEVAKEKNVSRAARNLYISQPALSQALKRIDKTYGITIFDKDFNLTKKGEIFVKYAVEIEKNINYLKRELDTDELNIGISQFYGKYYLNQILLSISRLNPEVKVNIKEDTSKYLEDDIVKGDLDIGFMPTPILNNLKHKTLFSEKLVLAMPKNFKEKDLKNKDHNLLTMHKGSKLRDLSDEFIDKNNIKVKDIIEATNLDTINSLIISKNAIALLPDIIERLDGINYMKTDLSREFDIVYKNSNKLNMDKFVEIFLEISKKVTI